MTKRNEDLTVFLSFSEGNPTLKSKEIKNQWERGQKIFKSLAHVGSIKKAPDLSALVNEREDLFNEDN